jgi:hypothetical protein
MPTVALKWRALAPVTLAANTLPDALNALYTAGTAVTYADGSTRTPGADSAWTWGRDTSSGLNQASYALPPTTGYAPTPGTVLGQALMWCGSSTAAPTNMVPYTYTTTDAKTQNMLYCGCVKNTTGVYIAGAWNTAAPFTTGQSTGFARAFVLPATATWSKLLMWECPEAVIVAFARTGPQIDTSWSGGGAIGDPGITGLGETDGRVYGVFTSGSNNYNSPSMWSNTSDAAFYETGVAGQSRFGVFVPGTATIIGYRRFGVFQPATTFLSRGSEVPLVPVYAARYDTAANGPSPIRLREIWLSRDGTCGQVLSNGGVTLGYVASAYAITSTADAAVLTV